MRKLLWLLMLVAVLGNVSGVETSSSSYKVNIYMGSGGMVAQNTTNETAYYGTGQVMIGNLTGATYHNLVGIYYIGATNTTITIVPTQGGGAPGSPAMVCNIELLNKSLVFTKDSLNTTLAVYNKGGYMIPITITKQEVPTVFGAKDILAVTDKIVVDRNRIEYLDVGLTDISQIREDTTVNLSLKSTRCDLSVPIYIQSVPPRYYDVRVSADKLLYSPNKVVNITVMLENKGDTPDKDTILKIYVIDPDGNKEYIYEEKLFEVSIGMTLIHENYYVTAPVGKYIVGVEYETEAQGLLTAQDTFYVTWFLSFNLIIIYAVIGVMLLIILLLVKRDKDKDTKNK